MKYKYLSVIALFALICGCEQPESQPSYLSFYGNDMDNSSAMSLIGKIQSLGVQVDKYSVFIDKIEISTEGQDWITVVEHSTVTIDNASLTLTSIIEDLEIPEDEYHGIRIYLAPTIILHDYYNASSGTVTGANASVNFVSGFSYIIAAGQNGIDYNYPDPITFSTANGGLSAPFTIEAGKDLHIILDFKFSFSPYETFPNGDPMPENLWLYTRVSRFTI